MIDVNCDMGEGCENDEAIMPYISSANIACGYHAGNEQKMQETILRAIKYNVHIGAHPSFNDRDNFGRKEVTISPTEVYDLVIQQIHILQKIAKKNNTSLHHVKPHGALYNMAAKDPQLAKAIARAVKDFNNQLVVYGLSGSHIISEANALNLRTANEVFADRTFNDDGTLIPRSDANALITNSDHSIKQVMDIVQKGFVTAHSGKKLPISAETICIHGDGINAVEIAMQLKRRLRFL